MRESVRLLEAAVLPVQPPPAAQLELLTQTVRGHLELLVPEVEQLARRLDEGSPVRHCMQACMGEARLGLRATPADRGGPVRHARRLARALATLCDHYEQSGSGR
ncbi:DUF6415 family natural product biosynthesis protein [Streptomyces sp. NPDC002328]|uniref:DUF6415 family natural product biosynthesis protein n=1 Tax=Streptomyces sp. NPDC002328 TaxID=3364642 RepID=UPI0036B9932D